MNAPLVVVMGVSGTGKSTTAQLLAAAFDARMVEGDDHHPRANVEKMKAGTPLTDDDRWPWLASLSRELAGAYERDEPLVVTCSALRRAYRDALRADLPDDAVAFVQLDLPEEALVARMEAREGHFMPASLLRSQLDTLEPLEADEHGVRLETTVRPSDVASEALDFVSHAEGISGSDEEA